MMDDLTLHYDRPAAEWTEALPVGNGRLGAMVFGGWPRERLQVNESTLYAGGPYDPVNPEALAHLAEVRALILAGRYAEAEALADRHLMATPLKQMPYQPAADLWIEHLGGPAGPSTRSLDLDSAIAECRCGTVVREVFASAADDVLVIRLATAEDAGLAVRFSLTSLQPGSTAVTSLGLRFTGTNRAYMGVPARLRFAVDLSVLAEGGIVTPEGEGLRVEGARSVVAILDAATSFRRFDDVSGDPLADLALRRKHRQDRTYDDLRDAHLAEHRRKFRRLSISLGPARPGSQAVTTDQRVRQNPANPEPALAALYVQFARYLMLSSSRPGGQPANLQGLWNDLTDPPWGSKYTANINLQMNYWLPDPANLAECFEPLMRMAEELTVTGAAMARKQYGARGWGLHHNTDLWRAAAPIDGAKWGLWPSGGAWICVQLWDHALYAGLPEPLLRRLLPVLEGALRFSLDILVALPGSDWLVTAPSNSPENVHPKGATICAGPAMDRQILRDLIDAYLGACDRLGLAGALADEARSVRQRIPPDRIGKAGQLQEWLEDWDMNAPEMQHRHVSHLYGLYPSQQISPERTPELAAAARRSLDIRGDNATGWGIGWRLNLWARLGEGDHCHDVLTLLLSPERTYPNLFDAHPPFQIDGNFGGAAGILEMLAQCDGTVVRLLPALPTAWPEGEVTGLRLRGGITADLGWQGGRLTTARLIASADRDVEVRANRHVAAARLMADRPWNWPGER